MTDLNRPIRVVLADDHELVLEGLRGLLERENDMTVVATATDEVAPCAYRKRTTGCGCHGSGNAHP